MYDTLKVGFKDFELSYQWLSNWKFRQRSGERETYRMSIHAANGNKVTATYHPKDIRGKPSPLLLFEFSAPKLVYDCNHYLIDDTLTIIEQANAVIHRLPDFASLSIENGTLYRVDFCYHHFVGKNIYDYVRVLQSLHYPHREVFSFLHNGVQFRSKQVSTQFYNKFKQCNHKDAKGILRQETSYRDKGRIEKLFEKNDPTILDLDNEIALPVLDADLRKLRLKDAIICDRSYANELLMDFYGKTRGKNLIGYLTLRQTFTREQLKDRYEYSQEIINKNERDIAKAGVVPILSNNITLPPLEINQK